ncbi:hypothetical protein DMUE_6207 [Dictyocoela muelleri]|nr:hypothetical protein DMUE_6207 [Dictyocoela muelleri]
MGDIEEPTKYFLVDVIETFLSVKNVTITIAVDDIIKEFNLNRNKFILLQTDSARYMIKAGENLKLFYPNLLHTICFAYILHNCAQKIKLNYRKVDDIIASMKGLTVKNQFRKNEFNHIGRRPSPIVTRWGSWLNAAFFLFRKYKRNKKCFR